MAVSLARVLLESGLLDVTWLGKATAIATEANVPVAHALTRWKLLEARPLAHALSRATGLAVIDIEGLHAPAAAPMQRQACHRLRVVPIRVDAGVLTLGMTDPTDDDAALQVEQALGMTVIRVLVDDDAVERALRRLFQRPGDEIRTPAPGFVMPGTGAGRGEPVRHVTGAVPAPGHTDDVTLPMPVAERPRAAPPLDSLPTAAAVGSPREQEMAVVLAEATSLEAAWEAGTANGELFLFTPSAPRAPALVPVSLSGFGESSGVFSSNNPNHSTEMGMPTDDTRQMVSPRLAVASTMHNDAPALTDEAPTLQNDVLGVTRVLVAVDDDAGDALIASLALRLRELRVVSLDRASTELDKRRFDVVVVVQPANTIAGSQQVAALAARAKGGISVVTDIADFARLPGVRGIVAPPRRPAELAAIIEKIIADKVRG